MTLPFRFTGRPLNAAPAPDRRERVYIYDRSGNLVNDPLAGLDSARGLVWRTGLPGGIWDAKFSVPVYTVEQWRIRPGYRIIIRRGLKPLYDGRVEDIGIDVTDDGQRNVLCMGWWQELRQRTGTWSWSTTGTTFYSDHVLRTALRDVCPDVSQDYSQVESPNVNLVPISWTRAAVSEIVLDLLKYGDDQSPPRRWYFAVWPVERPGLYSYTESGDELVLDPGFEDSSYDGGTYSNPNWSAVTHSGSNTLWFATAAVALAGGWCGSVGPGAAVSAGSWQTALLTGITASASYEYDYYIRFDASGTVVGRLEVDWYTSGDVFISTSSDTLLSYTNAPNVWLHRTGTFSAPGTAAKCRVRCYGARNSAGGGSYVYFDEVHFYETTTETPPEPDDRARAHFWPKDTTAWDYEIRLEDIYDRFELRESTETLVNSVTAEYGSSSATAAATDADSIADYDQRDYVLAAGNVSSTVATAARDLYLDENKDPKIISSALRLAGPLRRARGGIAVHQAEVRAGDRIKILGLPEQFDDFLFIVQESSYEAATGTLSLTPEAPLSSVDALLAQALG